jgi:unconventional prefoldin RPB5 interactor 1
MVLASKLLHPTETAPDLLDTLRKTGVLAAKESLDLTPPPEVDTSKLGKVQTLEDSTPNPPREQDTNSRKLVQDISVAYPRPILSTAERKHSTTKKSVAFAQDLSPVGSCSTKLAATPETVLTGLEDDLDAFNFNSGKKVIEIDANEMEIASYPVKPIDESPEDAALRKEMLQYGLAEVNSVVAEIDLEEGEDSDLDDDYDGEYPETDEDEEEDEYGRTTRRVVTDEYRKEMLELEKKLNARMLENIGPQSGTTKPPGSSDDIRRLVVQCEEPEEKEATSINSGVKKKGVRFAEELDVSPAPVIAQDMVIEKGQSQQVFTSKAHLADAIIERTQPAIGQNSSSLETGKPIKVSRFKSERSGMSAAVLTDVTSTNWANHSSELVQLPKSNLEAPAATLANLVVERNALEDDFVPLDEDGLHPALLAQELVVEYNKKRNRMIQDRGGFTPSEEDIENPLVEEIDGKVKKVSRFKAARLKSGGT